MDHGDKRRQLNPGGQLFSIGHSNHAPDRFLQLLQDAGITAVADVRSHPFSRWLPQYNWAELERTLRQHDLGYAFFGDSLGGRPQLPSLYDAEGRVDYERVRATALFQRGLDRLIEALDDQRVA